MGTDKLYCHSLSRGNETFTTDRLRTILENERFSYDHRTKPETRTYSDIDYGPVEIRCEIDTSFFEQEQRGDGIRCFSDHDAKNRAVRFCQELYGHSSNASIAVTRLDDMISRIFRFKFEPLEDSESIIERAIDLLERIPERPLELIDTPLAVPDEYCISSVVTTALNCTNVWDQLQATTY